MDKLYKLPYEKLDVWQLSKDFAKKIYLISSKLPSEEKYGLVSQLNRAAISVASNLAEGTSRSSRKDQARFTEMAFGSLMETSCQLTIAYELGMIAKVDVDDLMTQVMQLSNKLNALRKYQLSVK